MRIKKLLLTALTLFFSFSLYAANTIKIGASMPLTGMFAVPGSKHLEGYKMCVDMINQNGGWLGKKVILLGIDNRSDTETAISQYERFINVDKVDLVFGTFSSKLTFPTSTILAKYNYTLPIPSGGALRIYRRGFRTCFISSQILLNITENSFLEWFKTVRLLETSQRQLPLYMLTIFSQIRSLTVCWVIK